MSLRIVQHMVAKRQTAVCAPMVVLLSMSSCIQGSCSLSLNRECTEDVQTHALAPLVRIVTMPMRLHVNDREPQWADPRTQWADRAPTAEPTGRPWRKTLGRLRRRPENDVHIDVIF